QLPVYDSPQAERKYLKQAVDLFAKAGWVIKGGKMVNAKTGAPFKFEILGSNDTDQVIAGPWIANLRKIGVDATLRIIDQTQYINRVNNFDYDVITSILLQSESPGNEQRDFWSSKAADSPGS
ncbi:ABC transporter substrate-binding protein, partial [Mesorhizobium sp. M2E.F.Ca.ET.154.01.1.1]